MAVPVSDLTSAWSADLVQMVQDIQSQTTRFAMVGLGVTGFALLVLSTRFPGSTWSIALGIGLLAMDVFLWRVSSRSILACAYMMIPLFSFAVLLTVHFVHIEAVAFLLILPAGFATLMFNARGGISTTLLITLALAFSPPDLLPISPEGRQVCVIVAWSIVLMTWLALRPLLETVEWVWYGFQQNRSLLEEGREARGRLEQALEDLKSTNGQMARLNRLAQNLRQQAEEAQQAKMQFVANVSHELRTPLNMVIGFCEVILNKPEAYGKRAIPPALLADLMVILRNSQHLAGLIDDVLDLSQIDAGQMSLEKVWCDFPEIIDSALTAIRPLYESKRLYLEVENPPNMPKVFCDRTRIREVLLNLFSNAGRFTTQGGVSVRVWLEENTVNVSVADTGTGIDKEARDKLFQPFQQADGTIYRRFGGTGLGLSISKSFVELHGGKMWVDSELGKGATFFFRIPVTPLSQPVSGAGRWFNQYAILSQRTRLPVVRPTEIPPRLVIVEKGEELRKLLQHSLEGYEIVTSREINAAAADLEMAPAQALVINDVSFSYPLKSIHGELALPGSTPLIICSVPGLAEATDELGVQNYLVKPISRDSLLEAVGRIPAVRTILLADDDPDAQQLYRRILATSGESYRVLRALNGKEALEILEGEIVDLILLDLTMSEMDGFQFLNIKAGKPEIRKIPVILISARDPYGHPVASQTLSVVRGGGFSARQMAACIEAISAILSPVSGSGSPQSQIPPD